MALRLRRWGAVAWLLWLVGDCVAALPMRCRGLCVACAALLRSVAQ